MIAWEIVAITIYINIGRPGSYSLGPYESQSRVPPWFPSYKLGLTRIRGFVLPWNVVAISGQCELVLDYTNISVLYRLHFRVKKQDIKSLPGPLLSRDVVTKTMYRYLISGKREVFMNHMKVSVGCRFHFPGQKPTSKQAPGFRSFQVYRRYYYQ